DEKALQHGLVDVREGGAIRIAALRAGQKLRLEIRDNGQGLAGARPEQGRKRKGIGIGNLRERLELLFRRESSLTLVPLEQGTMAVLEMPLLIASPYQKPPLSK
ncbi:two-component sensor histidine kinase, partial [Paenibacillus macerans]|nr:two-component sensor histidine kinase [Paenibacillus macerans]